MARVDRVGLLTVILGALGLFYVLYTYADHIEPPLLAMVCLAAIFLGACTIGLRVPARLPRRRP